MRATRDLSERQLQSLEKACEAAKVSRVSWSNLTLPFLRDQNAGVSLPISLAGSGDQSFDLVFCRYLVGGLDKVGQVFEAKIRYFGKQADEQFFDFRGPSSIGLDPRQFEHAVLGKLRRGDLGCRDVVQVGFKQFAGRFHRSSFRSPSRVRPLRFR